MPMKACFAAAAALLATAVTGMPVTLKSQYMSKVSFTRQCDTS